MNEVCILHLSDLHIVNQRNDGKVAISTALKNLIVDIKNQTEFIDKIIIVVSGDIAYAGEIGKYSGAVIEFFESLSNAIPNKVISVQIVPGNHDFNREFAKENITKMEMNTDSFSTDSDFLLGYADYKKTIEEIFSVFKLPPNTFTFGVNAVELDDTSVCFVRFNTAFGSVGDNDKRSLHIGKYQLQKLLSDYRNIIHQCNVENKPVCLTLGISHYPFNWLNPIDEAEINEHMMKQDFLKIDILLCGHVHKFAILNYFNHEHSVMTLMTGIGWGNIKPENANDQHRYSIYMLDISRNTCDIIMRRTKDNLDFGFDYSVYTSEAEEDEKKFIYPLKMNKSATFLKMKSPNPILVKSIHINDDIMADIAVVSKCIANFRGALSLKLDEYKNDFLENFDEHVVKYNSKVFSEELLADKANYDVNIEKVRNKIEAFL